MSSNINPVDELSHILSVPPVQSAFILAALAAHGRVVFVDEANRDLRSFVDFLSRLTGRKAQCKYCSSRTSLDQADMSQPLILERMEALSPDEQTRLAEKLLFDGVSCLLVGTVNSRAEAENLSEELRAAIGAVIDLAPVSKSEIERLLKEGAGEAGSGADLSACWKKLCETCANQSQEDLVKPVAVLADWIGRVETSAVLSRPPIDALRSQAKILACLNSVAATYGPAQLAGFGAMNDIHASLLAHRLFRIEAGGRTNVGIVHAALDEASKELHLISKSSRAKDESLAEAWEVYAKIHEYMAKKVIGREDGAGGDGPDLGNDEKGLGTINLMLTALFSEGHILFEDFPGTGKSYMVEMLSDCISDDVIEVGINIAGYKRIQCVPDLMPSDITGYEALVGNRMVFRPGPVFAYFLLLDEINRTTPKVQAALLEAMAEKRVSVGNHRYNLGGIFFVLASQNPLDAVGTYPLPAAQLDRFLFKRRLEPVTQDAVNRIIATKPVREEGPRIPISRLRRAIRTVGDQDFIDPNWPEILPQLQAIREVVKDREAKKELQAGSTPSPRSMQKLGRALQALAFVKGAKERDPGKAKVHKSLIREIALDYFGHRIFPSDTLQSKWSEEGASPIQEHKKYVLSIIDEARAKAQESV
jgi:MoxR-like ATPase